MVQVAAALLFALAAGLGITVILAMLKSNESAILSALLGAALVTAPWLTLLAVCALYAATLPFGLASYAKVRRRGRTVAG